MFLFKKSSQSYHSYDNYKFSQQQDNELRLFLYVIMINNFLSAFSVIT